MTLMTLFHFAMLSFRGGATYNYYHHYVDKAAMFGWVKQLGLTAPALAPDAPRPGGILEWLGYIVHGDPSNLANSNVADVFNSIVNMISTITVIVVIALSVSFARRFGKKAVAVAGFGLSALNACAFYLLPPDAVNGMVALTILGSVVYAPTIPLIWAIYADVADYSEWKTGRRFTGIVFATIGFTLKAGLALGSASFLWIMAGFFQYDTKLPDATAAVAGFRATTGLVVGLMFAICTILLCAYQLNKQATIQMADELAERRHRAAQPGF
jgi:GPH family glycoside/pentoside/hexuronide:cation symporter